MRVVEAGGVVVSGDIIVFRAGLFETAACVFQFLDLFLSLLFHPAAPNEFHNPVQLIFLEPDSMRPADVHDYTAASREINSVHQGLAGGAGEIANFGVERLLARFESLMREAEHN